MEESRGTPEKVIPVISLRAEDEICQGKHRYKRRWRCPAAAGGAQLQVREPRSALLASQCQQRPQSQHLFLSLGTFTPSRLCSYPAWFVLAGFSGLLHRSSRTARSRRSRRLESRPALTHSPPA